MQNVDLQGLLCPKLMTPSIPSRSDCDNNRAGGQSQSSTHHAGCTLHGTTSPTEERHERTPPLTLNGAGGNSVPYHPTDVPPAGLARSRTAAVSVTPATRTSQACRESLLRTATNSYRLQLPSIREGSRLLQNSLNTLRPEYPCLDLGDIEVRLSQTLTRLGCPPGSLDLSPIITVDAESSSFMALVCALWALGQSTSSSAETVSCSDEPADRPPGYAMYETSRKVLQAFHGLQKPSLDTVRYHVMSTLYALRADMVDVALQTHAIAARLLTIVDPLSRQPRDHWHGTNETCLWWVVFILDHTLSQVSALPYVLRVDQLPDELRAGLELHGRNGQICDRLPAVSPSPISQAAEAVSSTVTLYLQVMGCLHCLWASFTDQMHSTPERGHRCSLRQSALLDTELRVLHASIPSKLRWETPRTDDGDVLGTCRRLSIFLVSASHCFP